MKCIFIKNYIVTNNSISLKKDDTHHLINVLRIKRNEYITLKNSSVAYTSKVDSIDGKSITFSILDKRLLIPPKLNITLCQSIIKGVNFDLILQKTTELGISKIIPYMAKRSVVKIPENKIKLKQRRWQTICEEAAKQCDADYIPTVNPIINHLSKIDCSTANKLIALENNPNPLKKMMANINKNKEIILLVGPEGGFEQKEIDYVYDLGFKSCRIADYILRSETAAISMVSNCFFYFSHHS
jgi:16S rRNA (uracil1498-N3)-methyltransferase